MSDVVRETSRMLEGMDPVLVEGEFIFCTTDNAEIAARGATMALGLFRETEGIALILARADAVSLGFDCNNPMRRIVLSVYSALDGVGLTAAVSSALGRNGIPCNLVAAYHHDHVFVPTGMADQAMAVLRAVQQEAVLRLPSKH
jgi:hypothetical protein